MSLSVWSSKMFPPVTYKVSIASALKYQRRSKGPSLVMRSLRSWSSWGVAFMSISMMYPAYWLVSCCNNVQLNLPYWDICASGEDIEMKESSSSSRHYCTSFKVSSRVESPHFMSSTQSRSWRWNRQSSDNEESEFINQHRSWFRVYHESFFNVLSVPR